MGLRIKTNVTALIAQRRLGENQKKLSDSLEKLSSGRSVNKSADNAAGLAVSEQIRAQTRSLKVAKRNAYDGISYIQIAEGGLNEVTNIVIRMRELSSQAASDTLSNRERGFLNKEFQQLKLETKRIIDSTEFNGTKVLKSEDNTPIRIFVGASNRSSDLEGNPPDVNENNDPDILTIDLSDLSGFSDSLDRVTNDSLSILPEDSDGGAKDLGPDGTDDLFNRLDSALNAVASYRATLGSVQSRLNSTITNIDIANENMQAAQSRISDVDYAEETTRYTQARILTQAGLAVSVQANSAPEMVLSLIRS